VSFDIPCGVMLLRVIPASEPESIKLVLPGYQGFGSMDSGS